MLEAPITLLLIEDDADEVLLLTGAMEDAGATDISVLHAGDLGSALGTLEARAVDAVLLDLSLPDSRGVDGVDSLVPVAGEAPVIVCTGLNDQDVAQEAIRRGAQDYLVKNPKLYGAVPRILRFAVERSRLVHSANRRVEQARKYTELLLTKVISVADAGLGIIDRKGQFSLVNPGLAELSGCNAPDLVGRDWTAILPDDVRDKAMAAYLDSLVGEPDFSRDNMKLQRLDGSIIDVSMRSVLLNLGDSNSGRVLSFSDRSGALSADLVGASLAGIASAANGAAGAEPTGSTAGNENGRPAPCSASRIRFAGLPEAKPALGENWHKARDRAYALAEGVLARHLGPDDHVARDSNGDFVIRFGSLSEHEAAAKARQIGREIRETVLTDSAGDLPEAQQLSRVLNPDTFDVVSDTDEIELTRSEIEDSANLADRVSDKIKSSIARSRARTEAMLLEFDKSCRTRLREVQKRDRSNASILLHDLDPDTRRQRDRLLDGPGDSRALLAEIDGIVLGNATEKMHELGGNGRSLVAVDVHFSTLDDSVLCNKYLALCQNLDQATASSLIFNIKAAPRDIHTTRLAWLASALKPYSRLRMMQLRRPSLGELNLGDAEIALVAIDHGDIMSGFYSNLEKGREIVKQIHDHGARVLVDRVTSVKAAHLFKDLDIDFVAYDVDIAMVA